MRPHFTSHWIGASMEEMKLFVLLASVISLEFDWRTNEILSLILLDSNPTASLNQTSLILTAFKACSSYYVQEGLETFIYPTFSV